MMSYTFLHFVCNYCIVNQNEKIGIGGVGSEDTRIRSASLSIAMLITACGVRSLRGTVSSWCARTCSVVILMPSKE